MVAASEISVAQARQFLISDLDLVDGPFVRGYFGLLVGGDRVQRFGEVGDHAVGVDWDPEVLTKAP